MKRETYDRWKSADEAEKLWLDLRDCISRLADNVGKFGSDGRFVRHLREYQEEADQCADVKRDCEREGLQELDRDPADDWLREAYQSEETFEDRIKRHLANASTSAAWEA